MKKSSGLLAIFMCICVCIMPNFVWAEDISAEAAITMELSTGRVLFAQNADRTMSMASTTKIMTALLALESEQLDEEITVTAEMLKTEGSSIYLQPGDRLTLRSLVIGLLLESGNDAALAIAIALDGSEKAFSLRMNRRAAQLGMNHTHFVTASGLDDEQHYTTAYDMALLAVTAMNNPDFENIVAQQTLSIDIYGPQARQRTFHNHNRLLREMDGCIGIKTGFTQKSGRCLVTCCERDGIRIAAVTLKAPDDWNDHKKLMKAAFSQVERLDFPTHELEISVPVVGAGEIQHTVLVEALDVTAVIPIGRADDVRMKMEAEPFLYAPIFKNQVVGHVSYWLDGEKIGDTALLTTEEISCILPKRTFWMRIWQAIQRFLGLAI